MAKITLKMAADALVKSVDDAALANDSFMVSVAILGQADAQGLEVKAIHAELTKRGYGDEVKLTSCYGRAFAGRLGMLPLKDGREITKPLSKIVTDMVRAYNRKGGADRIRAILATSGMTQQDALKLIIEFGTAPKSGPVKVTTPAEPEESEESAPTTAEDILQSISSLMAGLQKLQGTGDDRARAVALSARLAVWGGIPAQVVHAVA